MDVLNQNISNKMIVIIISIIIIVAISASTTYSLIYNSKKLSNNSYNTGLLDIAYDEGETLELSSHIPMDDVSGSSTEPYIITITNNGTVSFQFNLSILSTVENVDKIIDAKYIKVQIDENNPVRLSDLQNGTIYSNLIIDSGKELKIKIRMWLDEKTPNTEIGHVYSAKLVASGIAVINENILHTTSLGYQSLTKLRLDDKAKIKSDDGIIEIIENNSYSYYFKGDINYNYVLLNNKYYRIYKVDENGNIKVIYAGSIAHDNGYDDSKEKDTIIGNSNFNDNANNEIYTGYTYLDETNTINIDSDIKTMIDKWYEDNIKDTDIEQNIVDAIYCNDNNIECSLVKSYTVNPDIGNGILKYPVGLISYKELEIVGNKYLNNNISFWTMTQADSKNNEFYMYSYLDKFNTNKVNDVLGIRPVMTITANNLKGDGTKDNPYTY